MFFDKKGGLNFALKAYKLYLKAIFLCRKALVFL